MVKVSGTLARALLERSATRRAAEFSLDKLCFGPQKAFASSKSKRILARCSRRAGKTLGTAFRLLSNAITPPFGPQLYVTLTRLNAKQILWNELLKLNEDYNLGGLPHVAELILRMPEGADIVLGGANNEREIAKIRGKRFKGANIDEAQAVPDRILMPLVNDIIGPALIDFDGYLTLTGTPGPSLLGYFYEADKPTSPWEKHRWTLQDNPHIERLSGRSVSDLLADVRREHGWTETTPTYVREYLGRWVRDEDVLVFHVDPIRNTYDTLPDGSWRYVLGIDLGFVDSDAIAVLGWVGHDETVYLVEEYVAPKQGITPLVEQIRHFRDKYKPGRMVCDFGGLGTKIAEEMRRVHKLPLEPAQKYRKNEHIELLNDALRRGHFKAPKDGPFMEDSALLQWQTDAMARGVHKVDRDYHSDITDAVLYAYRATLAFMSKTLAAADPFEQTYLKRLADKQHHARSPEDVIESRIGAFADT